jgi:hypothetical protein
MKKHVWIVGLLMVLCLAGLVPALANAAEPDQQALTDLLNNLDQKIKDADQRRVAHPKFLEELRALVKEYRAKIRVVFLSEDFSDGDYYNNPEWVVDSGTFRVTKNRRLLSEAAVETKPTPSAPAEKEKTTPLGGILKDILKTPAEEEKTPSTAPAAEEAQIYTLASIGPTFEVDLMLVSRSTRGFMELVLLGGDENVPYYRVIYRPSSSRERPIEIVRERDGKSFTIDAAQQYVSLDDNVPHRIQWIRDSQGRMRILIDEKEVLSTYEFYYQRNFTGLAFVNRGGTYEVGPIIVYQAQETKTQ